MEAKIYVRLKISPSSGYVSVDEMFFEDKLNDEFNYTVELLTKYNKNQRYECLEGFKLQHILVNVKFDGRKGRIQREDVLKSMKNKGLVTYCDETIFGRLYKPTDELINIMEDQLRKRKELAGVA